MFYPKPNIQYKLVFQELKNVVESCMIITFTEQNNIYQSERCFGFTPYDGYDKYDERFVCYVCYMDNSILLNSCVTVKVLLNLEADAIYGKINSLNITKIYLEDEIIFTL